MKEKHLSIRVPENEMKILEKHAKKTKRTKTDLVREWIRSLEKVDCN
ncbi:CopG family transcriptional regulator [Nostoc sp. CENA543]|nr:ribbon-helix-helix domain-containing protein [Nostoc sp. CENA543]AUT03502.1 CopG family transcriptional regulator [Nostoc sp. CENA543]